METLGIVFSVILVIAFIYGVIHVIGEAWFYTSWKYSLANERRVCVKNGWNTSMPPEGKNVLVRDFKQDHDFSSWSIMVRHGDFMYMSDGSGSGYPVKCLSGWLEILEDAK